MPTAASAKRRAESSARRAARSDSVHAAARAGLAAHGAIWLLLGILALVLALQARSQETDQRGALQELAGTSLGWLLLLVLTIGLAAYAIWRVLEVVAGTETKERIASAVRAIIYAGFAASGVQILLEGHTSSQKGQEQGWTAKVMQHDGGRWLIGAVGVVIVAAGLFLAYQGVARKFEDGLSLGRLGAGARRAVEVLGVVGSTARGIVVGLAGVLAVVAAVTFDAKKDTGVDGALRTVRDAPAGRVLLVLVAVGLIMFGLFGFCEARLRRV